MLALFGTAEQSQQAAVLLEQANSGEQAANLALEARQALLA